MRGVALYPDPKGLLFSPHDVKGVQMGYAINPAEGNPAIFLDGEWKEIIPEGVWLQMTSSWDELIKNISDNYIDYPEYCAYPEIASQIKLNK